jgi:hypothetical protein
MAWSAFSLRASRLNQDQTGLALKYTIPLPEWSCTIIPQSTSTGSREFIAKERGRREFAGIGW